MLKLFFLFWFCSMKSLLFTKQTKPVFSCWRAQVFTNAPCNLILPQMKITLAVAVAVTKKSLRNTHASRLAARRRVKFFYRNFFENNSHYIAIFAVFLISHQYNIEVRREVVNNSQWPLFSFMILSYKSLEHYNQGDKKTQLFKIIKRPLLLKKSVTFQRKMMQIRLVCRRAVIDLDSAQMIQTQENIKAMAKKGKENQHTITSTQEIHKTIIITSMYKSNKRIVAKWAM